MDVSQSFTSLPALEYVQDPVGLVTETFALTDLQYTSTVNRGSRQQGQVEISAVDDSLRSFSFVTSYSLGGAVDALGLNIVVSSDASAGLAPLPIQTTA